jgi:hypothetical protein
MRPPEADVLAVILHGSVLRAVDGSGISLMRNEKKFLQPPRFPAAVEVAHTGGKWSSFRP